MFQKGAILTKILHYALICIKFSIPDAMNLEIYSKFVKLLRYTFYFCIFWQIFGVSNLNKLKIFLKLVRCYIITRNIGQHIYLLLPIIYCTWKPVVTA